MKAIYWIDMSCNIFFVDAKFKLLASVSYLATNFAGEQFTGHN